MCALAFSREVCCGTICIPRNKPFKIHNYINYCSMFIYKLINYTSLFTLFGSEKVFSSLTLGPVMTVLVAPDGCTLEPLTENAKLCGSVSKFTTFTLKYFFLSEGFVYSMADATMYLEEVSRVESSKVAPLEVVKKC